MSDPSPPCCGAIPDAVNFPPFETEDLRENLTRFLDTPFEQPGVTPTPVGNYRWGVYAFFDYDGEPIYVGQTNERLRTRIRRHLTNQRTDAVAMSVLDPFEVFEIEVWPLPHLQEANRSDAKARQQLDALERLITEQAVEKSQFKAILNEKDPPPVACPSRRRHLSAIGSSPNACTSCGPTRTSGSPAAP